MTLSPDTFSTEIYGSQDTLFPTKQAAKSTAAKAAVVALREAGKIPEAGVKHQRTTDPNDLPPGSTGLTQLLKGFDVDPSTTATTTIAVSSRQRLHQRAIELKLHAQPAYDIRPSSPSADGTEAFGFWDVCAVFDARDVAGEPRFAGRIGEVKRVFGKEKAKDACARKVMKTFRDIESDLLLEPETGE